MSLEKASVIARRRDALVGWGAEEGACAFCKEGRHEQEITPVTFLVRAD